MSSENAANYLALRKTFVLRGLTGFNCFFAQAPEDLSKLNPLSAGDQVVR